MPFFDKSVFLCAFMGRILAIDYGRKRVGLAVTDPLRLVANGLDTVHAKDVLVYLQQYMAREEVDKIVVGLPKQMDGSDSESMTYIRPFVNKLRQTFPDKEIVFMDERFTSVLAHKAMLDGGLRKKARQDKALVDKISAVIILQTYMESIFND